MWKQTNHHKQNRTEQNRTDQNRTEQNRTKQTKQATKPNITNITNKQNIAIARPWLELAAKERDWKEKLADIKAGRRTTNKRGLAQT